MTRKLVTPASRIGNISSVIATRNPLTEAPAADAKQARMIAKAESMVRFADSLGDMIGQPGSLEVLVMAAGMYGQGGDQKRAAATYERAAEISGPLNEALSLGCLKRAIQIYRDFAEEEEKHFTESRRNPTYARAAAEYYSHAAALCRKAANLVGIDNEAGYLEIINTAGALQRLAEQYREKILHTRTTDGCDRGNDCDCRCHYTNPSVRF